MTTLISEATTYQFIKQNKEPVPIECVPDEHEEARDFLPSFWWNNRRYFIQDFIRCHNNPWIGPVDYPEHIHAYEADQYVNPLFIELVDQEHINIYEEKEVKSPCPSSV